MQVKDEEKPYDDINITPMLDLAYVLLIIFIILTTASVQGIKVDLPKASATVSLAKPETKLMISLIPPGNPQEVLNTLIESAYNDAFDMGCAAVATSLMDAMVQKLAEGK